MAVRGMVNHPPHYNTGKFETIDVIEDWGLGFNDGNAVKYLSRWRTKHEDPAKKLEDLNKAGWYIERQKVQYKKELARGVEAGTKIKARASVKEKTKTQEEKK